MISIEEHQKRRLTLAKQLPSDCLVIVSGNQLSRRSHDTDYRFRQDSDFWYLTGLDEPDACLIIETGPSPVTHLFVQPRDPNKEQWNGRRLGADRAASKLFVDYAYDNTMLNETILTLMEGKNAVFWPFRRYVAIDTLCMDAMHQLSMKIRKGVTSPFKAEDITPHIAEMRVIKSESEINLMRKAANISVHAHQCAMKVVKQAKHEYELEAEIIHTFLQQGCRAPAYDSIVGGGDNSCILHYTENNMPLKSGDLVLIDAGGEYQNYAADITRTFPVSGEFSKEQKAIYDIVLHAQKQGIAIIKPGIYWDEVQKIMVRIITEGLCELGLLQGQLDDLIQAEAYKPFYMHNSGHWLGLDVHDAGTYKINNQWRQLEANMVLTVEPGIYIQAGLPVDEKWWNIGIRIEDDILVTASGHENLTGHLAKEIKDIEALIRG